jgi:hypothetical protein
MADATIDLEATDLFALHANFKTQSSGESTPSTNVQVLDELGNVSCQKNIIDMTSYNQSAQYCGSDFLADIGAVLTEFGNVSDSKLVTGVTINMSAGEYCTIDIEGHNHSANAHAAGLTVGYADVSDFLPHDVGEAFATWEGHVVPDFGITVGDDARPSSATVTFSMIHIDVNGESGTHLTGKNITPRCELSMDFEGIPTSSTAAALETDFGGNTNDMLVPLVDSIDKSDSNSAFDTFAFAAHANPALATE